MLYSTLFKHEIQIEPQKKHEFESKIISSEILTKKDHTVENCGNWFQNCSIFYPFKKETILIKKNSLFGTVCWENKKILANFKASSKAWKSPLIFDFLGLCSTFFIAAAEILSSRLLLLWILGSKKSTHTRNSSWIAYLRISGKDLLRNPNCKASIFTLIWTEKLRKKRLYIWSPWQMENL